MPSSCSGTGAGQRSDRRALPDRAAFAAQLGRITAGTTAAEALALLGEPDRRTPAALSWGGSEAPTLGTILLDAEGRVAQVFGAAPYRRIDLPEPRLREVLTRLFAVPDLDASCYSPVPVIDAVQALLPLGKALALDVVDEYLRVVPRGVPLAAPQAAPEDGTGTRAGTRTGMTTGMTTGITTGLTTGTTNGTTTGTDPQVPVGPRSGLFAVLRVLFAVPETTGHHPRVDLGAPWPAEPRDPDRFPRFPIALVDDVPYLVMRDYESTGYVQPVEDHVAHFRAHGSLRQAPLRPGQEGRAALEELVQRVRRHLAWDPALEAFLAAQFAALGRGQPESEVR